MKINLNAMNSKEVAALYLEAHKIISKDSLEAKMVFINDNETMWAEVGAKFKLQRQCLNITIKKMSEIIGCSTNKIRKFENGKPIVSAEMLKRSYEMALQLEHIKQEKEKMKTKDISDSDTLTYEETKSFYDLLWIWIEEEDNTYDLFKYIQDNIHVDAVLPLFNHPITSKFTQLLDDYIEKDDMMDIYQEHYAKYRKEIEEYKETHYSK